VAVQEALVHANLRLEVVLSVLVVPSGCLTIRVATNALHQS
jgi:hypothetical protein